MGKYNDLIELIVEEICEREGLKLGEVFKLEHKYLNVDIGYPHMQFIDKGLTSDGFYSNWNHIIFDILNEVYTIKKG